MKLELSPKLKNNIVDFLKSVPDISEKNRRYALVYKASLDSQLIGMVNFDEVTGKFCESFVYKLLAYEKPKNKKNPVLATLEAAKDFVDPAKKEYCETLIQELSIT